MCVCMCVCVCVSKVKLLFINRFLANIYLILFRVYLFYRHESFFSFRIPFLFLFNGFILFWARMYIFTKCTLVWHKATIAEY